MPFGTTLTIGTANAANDGGYFSMGGFNQTIGPLSSVGGLGLAGATTALPTITNLGTLTILETNLPTTFAGAINGAGGSVIVTNAVGGTPSVLTLTGTNAYNGTMAIGGGATLALSGNGAISNCSSLTIAAGSTFDVSGLTAGSYNLSSGTALFAAGSGTGASAATIKGASAGAVNLGSHLLSLTYSPTSLTGDSAHAALYVSQGSLTLGDNVIGINTPSALGAGVYTLITVAGGTINGTVAPGAAFSAAGLAPGTTGTVSISGGSVILTVVGASAPTQPTITAVSLVGGTSLVISATNGTPNGPYYLYATTNIATPFTNWTQVGTGSFDGSGNVTLTNTVNTTNPTQEFFHIQNP